MARKRARSSSGRPVVLGQLEDSLVEPEPGQLAVEEPVLELTRGERHLVGVVRRVDVEDVGRDDAQARVERALFGVGADGGLEALGGHGAKSDTAT